MPALTHYICVPRYGYWTLGKECEGSNFKQQHIIFDTTLCGGWAGNSFNADCPSHVPAGNSSMDACNAYVRSNPQAFAEANWLVNHVQVYGFSTTA